MNQRKTLALLLVAVLLMLSGCGSGDGENQGDETDTFVNDLPVNGLGIRHAQNFDIQYLADDVKLVVDSAGRELLLIPEGGRAPSGYKNAMQVTTPLKQAVVTSDTYVSFLGALEEDSIHTFITVATDVEGIVNAAPDLVFTDMASESGTALCTALDGLGIPYVVVAENRDTDFDAYLEWLKFFGTFYNLDQKASDLYDDKMDYLEGLYRKVSSVPESERPMVAFGAADSGIVYTQGGGSAIAQQLERAGAVYALRNLEGDGEVQLSMEEFHEKCKDADILIYNVLPMDMQGTLLDADPLFAEFTAYQNQRVYTMDNGYYMNSAKVVERFEDLLAICHPELEEGHVFTIYQPLQNY